MEVDLDADEAVGAEPADYIEWEYTRHDGGDVETMVKQRQRPRGRVQTPVRHAQGRARDRAREGGGTVG